MAPGANNFCYHSFMGSGKTEWKDQYRRLLRWRDRVHSYYELRPLNTPVDANYIRDDILAFFQNAHHLMHWLDQDTTTGMNEKSLLQDINKSIELKLCQDLCNGYKHFILRSPQSGKNPVLGVGMLEVNVGGKNSGIRLSSHTIDFSDGTSSDAKELVDKVVLEWNKILKQNGLID